MVAGLRGRVRPRTLHEERQVGDQRRVIRADVARLAAAQRERQRLVGLVDVGVGRRGLRERVERRFDELVAEREREQVLARQPANVLQRGMTTYGTDPEGVSAASA